MEAQRAKLPRVRCSRARMEEIVYRFPYCGDSEQMRTFILQTVVRLPRQVVEFARERCRFLSIGDVAAGMTLPAKILFDREEKTPENIWLILLAEEIPFEHVHSIIAHEIAHAWLKHDRYSPSIPEDCESQAAELVKQWGFHGRGADADYCEAPYRDLHRSPQAGGGPEGAS